MHPPTTPHSPTARRAPPPPPEPHQPTATPPRTSVHTALKRTLRIALAITLLANASPATAQPETTSSELLQFWTECADLVAVIQYPDPAAEAFGLTPETVHEVVTTHLQDAEILTTTPSPPYLSIDLLTHQTSFLLQLSFYKALLDPASQLISGSKTWDTTTYGNHANDSAFLLETLSHRLDRFAAEYLRINNPAC